MQLICLLELQGRLVRYLVVHPELALKAVQVLLASELLTVVEIVLLGCDIVPAHKARAQDLCSR